MKLQGKNILITGAARRIGRAMALELAAGGARILLHYRRSAKDVRSLEQEIRSLGGESLSFRADFEALKTSAAPKIKKWVREILKKAGTVDVLINNASVFYPTPLEKLSEKDWDRFMAVNLKVPFFLAREIGLGMKKRGRGKIINLVDWTPKKAPARFIPYVISKAGLWTATLGLAKALAPKVQVLGIAPGPILPAESASPRQRREAAERSLLGRYGAPEDIARTVRFLIEGTDFMTGSVIHVDGGASLY